MIAMLILAHIKSFNRSLFSLIRIRDVLVLDYTCHFYPNSCWFAQQLLQRLDSIPDWARPNWGCLSSMSSKGLGMLWRMFDLAAKRLLCTLALPGKNDAAKKSLIFILCNIREKRLNLLFSVVLNKLYYYYKERDNAEMKSVINLIPYKGSLKWRVFSIKLE